MRVLQKVLLATALPACVLYIPSSHASTSDTGNVVKLQADAERGSVLSEIELAADYLVGNGIGQDAKLAAHWYEKAAQYGNPAAENQIGYFYQFGIGVPVDMNRSLHWYQLAAASGYIVAKVNLGVLYANGVGVPKNVNLAVQLFKEAIQEGNGAAATFLGDIYYFGLPGRPDPAEAERWFEVGARLHDPMAFYNLGSLYSVNADHSHDFPRAADLLRRSAKGGYVPAMHSLGLLLINHPEVEQAPREAQSLLETAAAAGQWKSSIVLGILARDGRGVPVDAKAALYYFQIAILQGGDAAERLVRHDVTQLRASFDAKEYAALNNAAGAWYGQHRSPQRFISRNAVVDKYFPVPSVPETTDAAFAQQAIPSPAS